MDFPAEILLRRAIPAGPAPDVIKHPTVQLARECVGQQIGPLQNAWSHRPGSRLVYDCPLKLIEVGLGQDARDQSLPIILAERRGVSRRLERVGHGFGFSGRSPTA